LPVLRWLGQFGVAIANISSSTLNLEVRFNGSDGRNVVRTISIPPGAQYVKFVHEILDLSQAADDGIFVVSNSQSSTPFYMTGLMFKGATFTTLVPN
jgi:hypothetical protein